MFSLSAFRSRRAKSLLSALCAAIVLSNCGDDGPTEPNTPPPVDVATVVISGVPAEGVVLQGGTVQLQASARDAGGTTLSGRQINWASSNTSVATVSSTGLVTAVVAGSTNITASSEGKVATTAISVRVPVTVPPPNAPAPTTTTVLNGAVTITIPPGAAPATTTALTVAPAPAAPADDRVVANSTYDFGPAGTVFSTPITIALRFDPAQIPAEDRPELRVFLVETNGSLTEIEGSATNLTDNTVTAPVTHFSRYTIIRRARPTQMAINTGNNQTAQISTVLPVRPSVIVRDALNRPVPRVAVTFAVTGGGGSISGAATTVTGTNGIATLPGNWTLGPTAGANALTATLAAFPVAPVVFNATATTPPLPAIGLTPSTINFAGQAASTNPAAQTVAVANTVANSSALTGLAVGTITYGAGATGWLAGALNVTTAPATLTLTPNITGLAAGSYTATVPVTSSVAGVAPANVAVTLTLGASAASRLAVITQPAGAVAGESFTTQPVVEIRDANGVKVATAANSVTATITTGTGTLLGTATVNAVNGVATFAGLGINGTGAHVITFSSTGLTSAASASFDVLPPPPTITFAPSAPTFTQERGGVNPAPIVVNVTSSSATVPITGITLGAVAYSPGATGWLTAVAGGPASPTTITLTAVTGTLPIGTHLANVPITSSAGNNFLTVRFVITPLPPTQLAIVTQPAGAVSGVNLTTQPVIELRDRNNGRVDGAVNTVTAAIASGTGTLVGTTTVTAVNGTATFTNLRINGNGAHTLTFTSGTLTAATSSSFTVTQNAASLAVVTQPAGAVSGSALTTQPVVEVRDNAGLRVLGATNAVTVAIGTGTGTRVGTATVNAVDGTATFTNVQINGFGAHTLAFTSGTLTGATSNSFTVTQVATALAIRTQPNGAQDGIAFATQPVIEVRDAAGIVVDGSTAAVTASVASGGGTLAGTATVNAVNGVATFAGLRLGGALGAHTLAFASTGLTGVTSASFTVTSGPPTQLVITTQPGGASSGSIFGTQPVLEIRDASGNLATGDTRAVTVAVATGTGAFIGTKTVNAVGGIATFTNLQINGGGAHTLIFTAGASGVLPALSSATSASFTVTQTATALAITTQPAGAGNGAPFTTQPVVRIVDAAGLTVVGSTANVTASIGSGTGTLGGTATIAAVAGVATFTNLSVTGAGAHTLTFASAGLTSVTSNSFTPAAGAGTQVAILTQPAGAVSGVALTTQPVIEIRDIGGARATSFSGTITATIATGTGSIGAGATAIATAGVATFTGLRIDGVGNHTITFSTGALTPATSGTVAVTQNVATLAVTTQPSGAFSGAPFTTQPVVTLRDNAGLAVQGNTAAVTVTRATGTGTLAGTTTVNAVNGVATFTDLQFNGGANTSHSLTFTTTTPALTATSAAFTVGSSPPTQLAIATQPSATATSGVALAVQPVIQLRDAGGAVSTSATNAVTAALVGAGGTLVGTATVNAVAGVATFAGLRIDGPGTFQLLFTSGTLTNATSANIVVTQTVAGLVIQTQPAGATTGVNLTTQPVIRIVDNAGLTVTNSTLTVTATRTTGTATLSGTTAVAAVAGIATFTDLQLSGSGANVLTFSTTTPALSVASNSINVAAGAASQLAITTQPAGSVSGVNLTTQPVIAIRDAGGNLTSSTANVTVAIASGTGALVGTTTVAAVNGVATFTNLRINGSGAHTLTFTSAGLTAATSSSFTTTQVAASLAIQTEPAGAETGSPFTTQPVVRVLDNAGLVVTTGSGATLAVTAARTTGTGTLGGTVTVNAVNGVATFTNLVITGTGAHVLTFSTTTPALSVASASFNVTAVAPGIRLNVGDAATRAVTTNTNFTVPINLDLSNRGTDNLASITVNITWDPSKFTYVSNTAGNWVDSGGDGATVLVNAASAGTGTFSISGFTNVATLQSFILRNITFTPIAGGTATIAATITAAGNEAGSNITVIARNLSVTATP